jgi:hypothetical protein
MNMPHSGSNSSDDVWWEDCARFEGKEVVVTEKLDGECTTIYPDAHIHARSIDTRHHPSRSWMKALAAVATIDMSYGCRICGENLFAWHSIFYTELPSYFFVFGMYEEDVCLSWDETEDICKHLMELELVPVIYRGLWDEEKIKELWTGTGAFPTFSDPDQKTICEAEGYVVRLAEEFPYADFRECCAKYVRPAHVTTDQNWMTRKVVPNLLKM